MSPLIPQWADPQGAAGVGSLMATRVGGVSAAPWDSLNLGSLVGDAAQNVAQNRHIFCSALEGAQPVFLKQVHGTAVVRLSADHAASDAPQIEADACITTAPQLACTIMVADCLPVLFAAPQGRAVGAAHAGWRGLAAGVLQATLRELTQAAPCRADQVQAWLGPCIGPHKFEVGTEVLAAFTALLGADAARYFQPQASLQKWHADLPGLARHLLRAAGVVHISGGGWCTVQETSRFFSYRRDGITGRMAAAIWIPH
jgi:polyphenol oxidase